MSIFSDLKPFAKNNRNVFDNSRTETLSAKVGMMTPVFIQHTTPDTKLKVDVGAIVRTAPMQKANFTTIKSDVDFFFVPYRQLWSHFSEFYYGRGDNQNNVNNHQVPNSIPTGVPTFDYPLVCRALIFKSLEQFFVKRLEELYKLAYDKGVFSDFAIRVRRQGSDDTTTYFGLVPYEVAQERLNALRERLFGLPFGSSAWSPDLATYRDIHGRICALDMVRNFDLLGYGNLWPFIKVYIAAFESFFDKLLVPEFAAHILDVYNDNHVTWTNETHFNLLFGTLFVQDYITASGTSSDLGRLASVFNNFVTNFMADSKESGKMFGFAFGNILPYEIPANSLFKPNALNLCAAFKVWCDFYRQSQYDIKDYAYLYNFDYFRVGNGVNAVSIEKVLNLLVPNYHLYKRDIFTGGYPNAQFGDVAVAGLTPEYSDMVVREDTNPSVDGLLSSENGSVVVNLFNDGSLQLKNSAAVSALAVRQALAIQKWKETILRAGNRERDLLESMFGVHSKYINDKYVDYVASFNGQININPVASTTENEGASLGELGAYAVGTIQGKEFDFATNEFGILIGLMYITPEVKYDAFGFDPFVTKTEQNDYYNPKFQNLGLAPVTSLTYNIFGNPNSETLVPEPEVLSYLSRYWEYKTRISRVHGDFYNSMPVTAEEVQSTGSEHPIHGWLAAQRGSKSAMVSVRDVHALEKAVLQSLYIAPNAIDTLFYSDEDGTYSTDQFDIEISFQVKAILPMSVEGLPNY